MTPFEVQTPRLRIREWDDEDELAFQRLVSAPGIAEWFTDDESLDPQQPFIARMKANQTEYGWSLWAVELLRPTHTDPIGPIGYVGFGTESLPDPEIAWTLLPEVWGRGYATEAGLAVRDYGFGTLGMPHIVSVIDPSNVRSARVATKIGLVQTGLVECHGVAHLLFEMDERRWRERRG